MWCICGLVWWISMGICFTVLSLWFDGIFTCKLYNFLFNYFSINMCYQECSPATQRLLWESLADDSWQMQDSWARVRSHSQLHTFYRSQLAIHLLTDALVVFLSEDVAASSLQYFRQNSFLFQWKQPATPIICSFFYFSRRILFKIIFSLMIVVDKYRLITIESYIKRDFNMLTVGRQKGKR